MSISYSLLRTSLYSIIFYTPNCNIKLNVSNVKNEVYGKRIGQMLREPQTIGASGRAVLMRHTVRQSPAQIVHLASDRPASFVEVGCSKV